MKRTLIFYEEKYGHFTEDLIEVANQMYGQYVETYTLLINTDCVNDLYVFDFKIIVSDRRIQNYDIVNITNIMEELQREYNFDSILIPATHLGRMLAPRLAMRLKVGLVADVTGIKVHGDGKIEIIRPSFDGKVMAGIMHTRGKPIMMSVRPGIFSDEKREQKSTVTINFEPTNIIKNHMQRIERKEKPSKEDIRESAILIAGGGGIIGSFSELDHLVEALGGMKAASRRIVDSGKADRNIQVGQSGKIVNPDLYIALGIYGALQHVAGINSVKHLIAVNTNANAPICSLADIVVEDDAAEFVRKLTKRIIEGNKVIKK